MGEIRTACRVLVTIARQGDAVYNILNDEVDKSTCSLIAVLKDKDDAENLVWLEEFVSSMEWLDRRTVSTTLRYILSAAALANVSHRERTSYDQCWLIWIAFVPRRKGIIAAFGM